MRQLEFFRTMPSNIRFSLSCQRNSRVCCLHLSRPSRGEHRTNSSSSEFRYGVGTTEQVEQNDDCEEEEQEVEEEEEESKEEAEEACKA